MASTQHGHGIKGVDIKDFNGHRLVTNQTGSDLPGHTDMKRPQSATATIAARTRGGVAPRHMTAE